MELSAITMGRVEDFLETIPSKHTRKNYVNGIKKFEKWYGDSITELIKNPEATKTVEKFYVALKQKHPQNTCRNVTNAVIQFLKYFGTDIRPRKALGIYRTEVATDNHRLTIEEVQKMASVTDLKEQVMLEVLLLGLRIGDAITLKVSDLNKLEQEAPIELKLRATKEGTVYETFISQEFKELLQLYLPTVKGKWLFQGIRKDSHAKDETLNLALRNLAKRAGIQLHGRLHWHCGRSLVYTMGIQLGISNIIMKRMIGKSVPKSDDTYLYPDMKEGFLKLSSVLKLKPKTVNGKLSNLEEDSKLFAEALWELVKPIVEKKRFEKLTQRAQGGRVDLLEMEPIPTDPREGLKLFLKMRREVEQ